MITMLVVRADARHFRVVSSKSVTSELLVFDTTPAVIMLLMVDKRAPALVLESMCSAIDKFDRVET